MKNLFRLATVIVVLSIIGFVIYLGVPNTIHMFDVANDYWKIGITITREGD